MTSPTMLPPDEERRLVEELTVSALTERLPEELGVFAARRDVYLDARGTIPPPDATGDEATAFGAELAFALSPYIVAGALAAVRFVVGLFTDAIKTETKPQFSRLVRRLFRLGPPEPQTSADDDALRSLPPDTLARVHDVVLTVCRQNGLGDDDAALVSDAVAGRLALSA